jgi:predicted nucleic acid-binding protein
MAMTVADTDVLIDYLHGAEPGAGLVAEGIEKGLLRTTAITRFELWSGVRTARQETALRDLLGAVPALPLDDSGADEAARIRRTLDRAGVSIGMADSLIAGIVVANAAGLLTRNREHFDRVPGLRLVGSAVQ